MSNDYEDIKKWLRKSHTKLHCKKCGAFVSADQESTLATIHYSCKNCKSDGYLTIRDV